VATQCKRRVNDQQGGIATSEIYMAVLWVFLQIMVHTWKNVTSYLTNVISKSNTEKCQALIELPWKVGVHWMSKTRRLQQK
jgi:hypothetical protein